MTTTEIPKVYAAISAVTAELAKVGISKDSTNKHQNYKFRGIDAVYGALAPMLPKNKLVVLPRVVNRIVTEHQSNSGGTLFYTVLTVEFDFVSTEDASTHTVITIGEAMDSGDKSSNKAMSAAYKYACFQAFCIPTEGDNDADATTHQVAATQQTVSATWVAPVRTSAEKSAATKKANEYAVKIMDASKDINGEANLLSLYKETLDDEHFAAAVWNCLPKSLQQRIWDLVSPQKRETARTPENAR